jgi:hypothetical protein
MWRNWDAAQVEKDLDLLAAHDMTILRVFPLWPDFQPLTADEAGVKRLVRSDNPSVGFTEHRADGVTYVLAVNYSPIAAQCRIETEGRILRVFGNGTYNDGILSLGANDGVVLEVLSEKRYNSR